MAMSVFLGKLANWIISCIVAFLVGGDAAMSFWTRRTNYRLDFQNRALSAKFAVYKHLVKFQDKYIKKLEHKNAKLTKANSNSKKSN